MNGLSSHSGAPSDSEAIRTGQERFVSMTAALLDQGSQSLISLTVVVSTARVLPTAEFGAFGIVFAGLIAVWTVGRAMVVQPLLIVTAAEGGAASRDGWRVAQMLLSAAGPISLVLFVSAIWLEGIWQQSVGFVAATLPVICVLEAGRAIALAQDDTPRLILIAATWLVSMLAGSLVFELSGLEFPFILLVFLAATALAASVGVAGLIPSADEETPHSSGFGLVSVKELGVPLAAESVLTLLTVQALIPMVGTLAGLDAAAGVRGAATIAGPITTLIAGLRLGVIADATRYLTDEGSGAVVRYFRRVTGLLLLVSTPVAISLWWLSHRSGSVLLGESWASSRPLIGPFLVAGVIAAPHLVASSILRAQRRASFVLRIRVVVTGLILVPELIGVLTAGAIGGVLGLVVGTGAAAVVWGWAILPTDGSHRARPTAVVADR